MSHVEVSCAVSSHDNENKTRAGIKVELIDVISFNSKVCLHEPEIVAVTVDVGLVRAALTVAPIPPPKFSVRAAIPLAAAASLTAGANSPRWMEWSVGAGSAREIRGARRGAAR